MTGRPRKANLPEGYKFKSLFDNQPKVLGEKLPRRLHDVRWMSIYGVVESIIRSLPSIIQFARAEADTVSSNKVAASKLLEQLTNVENVLYLHLIFPVLTVLQRLSKHMQYELLDFESMQTSL